MINCIIKLAHYFTQPHTPTILRSLLFQPYETSGPPSIDNSAHDTEKLLQNTKVSEDLFIS
jgi:hypothetical protein